MREQLALLGGQPAVTTSYPAYPLIDAEEVCAATRVVMSRSLSEVGRGPYVGELEDALAAYFGVPYVLSSSSGTAAIHSALFAVGVKPGDEVLTANHNWISAIMAIFHAGAVPVLCDVSDGGFSLDPDEIRRKVTPNTKAVIATHLWGLPADMDGILAVAKEFGLPVIEDVSHAHGGKYHGQFFGTIGDIGCFSLQGSKAMVAGEGGFLITNNERYYQRAIIPGSHTCRLGREMILDELTPFNAAGGMWTYRMHPVAAAIATAQLAKLPGMNAARQANFNRLAARIADIPFITWPEIPADSVRGWYGTPAFYCSEKANGISRDRFVRACQAEGAGLQGEGYCDWSQIPLLHDMALLSQLVTVKHANGVEFTPATAGAFPHNEAIRQQMLLFSIPAVESPQLIDQVADALHKVADQLDAVQEYQPAG